MCHPGPGGAAVRRWLVRLPAQPQAWLTAPSPSSSPLCIERSSFSPGQCIPVTLQLLASTLMQLMAFLPLFSSDVHGVSPVCWSGTHLAAPPDPRLPRGSGQPILRPLALWARRRALVCPAPSLPALLWGPQEVPSVLQSGVSPRDSLLRPPLGHAQAERKDSATLVPYRKGAAREAPLHFVPLCPWA